MLAGVFNVSQLFMRI